MSWCWRNSTDSWSATICHGPAIKVSMVLGEPRLGPGLQHKMLRHVYAVLAGVSVALLDRSRFVSGDWSLGRERCNCVASYRWTRTSTYCKKCVSGSTTTLAVPLITFFLLVKKTAHNTDPTHDREHGWQWRCRGSLRKGLPISLFTQCSLNVPRARCACAVTQCALDDYNKIVLNARCQRPTQQS